MIRLDTGKRIPDDTPLLWGPEFRLVLLATGLASRKRRAGDVPYLRPTPDAKWCVRVIEDAVPVRELRRQLFLAEVRAAHAGGGA